jgi:hypothetical protein
MERAMRFQEVILRAVSKQISWMQAAEILGMSDRNMRRYRNRLEKGGYDGLIDRRTQRPSPKRVPMAEVERVLVGEGRSGREKWGHTFEVEEKWGHTFEVEEKWGHTFGMQGQEKWGHTFGTESGEK